MVRTQSPHSCRLPVECSICAAVHVYGTLELAGTSSVAEVGLFGTLIDDCDDPGMGE